MSTREEINAAMRAIPEGEIFLTTYERHFKQTIACLRIRLPSNRTGVLVGSRGVYHPDNPRSVQPLNYERNWIPSVRVHPLPSAVQQALLGYVKLAHGEGIKLDLNEILKTLGVEIKELS
jgi:hypothetical protein